MSSAPRDAAAGLAADDPAGAAHPRDGWPLAAALLLFLMLAAMSVAYGFQYRADPADPLAYFLPFSVSAQTFSHIIAVLIYGLALGLNIWVFAHWQDRAKQAKAREELEATSDYGRPLVKQG